MGVINSDVIQTLRDREMDRKEFLKYSGLALLSLFGFRFIASLLSTSDTKTAPTVSSSNSHGFGSGKYGV